MASMVSIVGLEMLPAQNGSRPDLVCPTVGCANYCVMYKAVYGWYATCLACNIRWTYITGDAFVMAERYNPSTNATRPVT